MSGTIGNEVNPISLDPLIASLSGRMPVFSTGQALPTSNLGPIFHLDYMSIMTWQVYNSNGASYTGYASIEIGMPSLDSQQTPRIGYIKRAGQSISITTYSPLWNWALHNGRVVPLGSWVVGDFTFANNGDGTFKVPDTRGYFERAWSDGSSIDSGRAFGSGQADEIKQHLHSGTSLTFAGNALPGHGHALYGAAAGGTNDGLAAARVVQGSNSTTSNNYYTQGAAQPYVQSVSAGTPSGTIGGNTGSTGGTETRPLNFALLGVIKF